MGTSNGEFTEALADIYDSAVDPGAWKRLPAVLTRLMGARTCAVYFDTRRSVTEMVGTESLGQGVEQYSAHYHQHDPWSLHVRRFVPGKFSFLGDQLVPSSVFAESEYYRDFARHLGVFHLLATYFPLTPSDSFCVAMHRPRAAAPFDEDDRMALDSLLPHLERAAQLRRRFQAAEARAATSFAALSALSFALVVCDAAGSVRFANEAASALDGAGLSLGNAARPLAATRPADTRELRRLVCDAATGGAGGALRIADARGGVLLALVSPLPPALRERPGREGLALVALRPAGEAPAFGRAVLAALFGLTPAEADLALALLSPGSLEEIAAGRGVSMPTVRTQLRSLFAKTGTENQRDLVRLLGTIPQIR